MFGMSTADWMELQAYRATGLTPEAVQEMVSFPYTADDEEGPEMEVSSKSAIAKITTIAEFLENLGEKQMAAELAGAARALKSDPTPLDIVQTLRDNGIDIEGEGK